MVGHQVKLMKIQEYSVIQVQDDSSQTWHSHLRYHQALHNKDKLNTPKTGSVRIHSG